MWADWLLLENSADQKDGTRTHAADVDAGLMLVCLPGNRPW